MFVLGFVLCVALHHTEASSQRDSVPLLSARLTGGSEVIPVGNMAPLLSSRTPVQTCCQAIPVMCNSDGDCIFDSETCTRLCLCVGGLGSPVCAQILQEIRNKLTSSPLSYTSSYSREGSKDTSTTIPELLPSSSANTLSNVRLGVNTNDTYYAVPTESKVDNIVATPVLEPTPASVTTSPVVPSPHRESNNTGVLTRLIKPRFRSQTASTVFNDTLVSSNISGSAGSADNASKTPNYLLDLSAAAEQNLGNFNNTNNTDDDLTTSTSDAYSDFIPPVFDPSAGCENCSGKCILNWKGVPSFECEYEKNDNLCDNFFCGDHGKCVTDENGHLKCKCFANYTGLFCKDVCDRDCGEMGRCTFLNNTMHCECKWNFTGEDCSELVPTTTPTVVREYMLASESEPWTVIGACIGMLLVLVSLILVLAYWTWRIRWLPMRRLIHYFQQYEDDDGKEFDAFISYKSTKRDEDFVVHKLYPKLEKELDFKLCMHFRDFQPGAAIADNIINAIENSRRTIMILSPAYIESEWCRLEYQKAQHEMLKRKHRIIPVLLEDISEVNDIDSNLKQIINTVTYINWPGEENSKRLDRFWKLMECALPKKKHDSGQSETSAGGSSSSDIPLTSVGACHLLDSLSDDVFPVRRESGESTSDDINNEIIERSVKPVEKCKSDTVINLSNDTVKEGKIWTTSNSEKPTSDDHVVEIRRLPGNRLKILRRFRLDLNFGRKTT